MHKKRCFICREGNKAMYTSEECVVCLDAIPELGFGKCRHQCVCSSCFASLPAVKERRKTFPCPLCRAESRLSMVFIAVSVEDAIYRSFDARAPNEELAMFVEKISSIDMSPGLLSSILRERYSADPGVIGYEMALSSFSLVKSHHPNNELTELEKVFTSLSDFPWKMEKLRNGLCYHGNFGERPSIQLAYSMFTENHRFLLGA